MFFTPLQMLQIGTGVYLRNKIAIEQNKIAADQLDALKRIEKQQHETLKRIEEQNRKLSETHSASVQLRIPEETHNHPLIHVPAEKTPAQIEREKYEKAMEGKISKRGDGNTYKYKCPDCKKTSFYTPSKDRKKKPCHICPKCAHLFSDADRTLFRKV